jgi:ABC-2 type transport system ATP-binding protein
MQAAVEIEQLRKAFLVRTREPGALRVLGAAQVRQVMAVDEVSFVIERGERVAFVGPNGAGKSTTIKILSGILHPSAGRVRVLGLVPWQDREPLSYRLGTVFGQRTQLFHQLPAADAFGLLRHVYDLPPAAFRARRDALVEAFGIGPKLHTPVRQLSLGERMRCEIAASLLHAPELLLLDEPTIGLDVDAKAAIRDLLREQAERFGRTLLLTSHDTADMERVCERAIVIHHGRVLLDAPVAALRRSFLRRKRLTLQTAEREVQVSVPGARVRARSPYRLELEVDVAVTPIDAVIAALLRAGSLKDLTVEDPPMDEVVRAIYAAAPPVAEPAPKGSPP